MKGRKQKAPAAPPDTAAATPFFARFLESQEPEEDAEAKVSSSHGRAQATAKSRGAKKGAAKKGGAKKSAGTKKAAARLATLKYPSDKDEYIFFPYHVEAARVRPDTSPQTMKAPSDGDELPAFAATYVDRRDVPAAARAKPKEARVKFTVPSRDIYEAG